MPKLSPEYNHKALYPEIAKLWHPTKNDKGPECYTHGSKFSPWWLCDDGHEWRSPINSMSRGYGCKECAGGVSAANNLQNTHSEIAKRWHRTKNDKRPDEVTYGSTYIARWICSQGHEWAASVSSMSRARGNGCRYCSPQSSTPEIRLLSEFQYLFSNVKHRRDLHGIEIDVFIPEQKIGVEYDGSYYHKGKEDADTRKISNLKEHGIEVFSVRHHPLEPISDNCITVFDDDLQKSDLDQLIRKISLFLTDLPNTYFQDYLKQTQFMAEDSFRTYLSYFPSPFPEHCIENTHSEVAGQWHFEKNFPLKPENFTPGSDKKFWWQCEKGHEWEARIKDRTGGTGVSAKTRAKGCPDCTGTRASTDYNLAVLHPNLAEQWDFEKNVPLKPEDVTLGSGQKVWWNCEKGHSWLSPISTRVNGSRCLYCPGGREASPDNNLAILYPEVASEWHPTRNEKGPQHWSLGTG